MIQELPLAEVPVDNNDNPYPREDALLYNALSGPSRAYVSPSNAPPPRPPLPEQQLGFPGPPPATPSSTYVRATPTTHDSNNAHVSQHDCQTNITLSTRATQPTETPAPQQDAKNIEHIIQLRTTAPSTQSQPPTSAHSTTITNNAQASKTTNRDRQPSTLNAGAKVFVLLCQPHDTLPYTAQGIIRKPGEPMWISCANGI